MKGFYFFLLLFVTLFISCQRQKLIPIKTEGGDYEKADSFLNRQNDSAFYYYYKAATNSKDSILIAMAYNSMAIIQSDAGDYFGSQQNLLLSISFLNELNEKDQYCLYSDYTELGNTNLELKNYDAALNYYNLASKFTKDKDAEIRNLNNQAVAYQKLKQYDKAITIYNSILDLSKTNKKRYARVISNLAKTKWLKDTSYFAASEFIQSLQIRKEEKDLGGLNASYAHLSDYYLRSHPDSSLFYANKMYGTARELNNPNDELEALQKLIQLSPPTELKPYFTRYQYLNDSVQTSRNNAKNQFASIRFDAEKNRTENLKLQKENTEKRDQVIILFATLIIATAAIVIGILYYRKRQQKTKWEAQNQIQQSKLKTSKRVHDIVANGLYQLMSKIEYNTIEKDQLLDEIETLYENSRDISYEQPIINQVDFHEEIKQLLTSFSTPGVKVLLTGNEKELWNNLNEKAKYELKHVLQELMVNMRKHSSAQNVVVKFEQHKGKLHIQYTDDGIGLQGELKKGNGLTNTGTRIIDIGGELIFESQRTSGLRIHIYIPIA